MTHNEYLIELDACGPARTYAEGFPTLKAAWDACTVPDWLIWLAINAAWKRRWMGEIESSDVASLRNTCYAVAHLSCDQIRAAISCPEVPDHE